MFGAYSFIVLACLLAGLAWPAKAYTPHKHRDATSPSVILPPHGFHRSYEKAGRAKKIATYAAESTLDNKSATLLEVGHHKSNGDEVATNCSEQEDVLSGDTPLEKPALERQVSAVSTSEVIFGTGVVTKRFKPDPDDKKKRYNRTFKEQISSGYLWACVFFVTLGIVFSNSFIATLGSNLVHKCADSNITGLEMKETIELYVLIFTVLTAVAVIALPAFGCVLDRCGTASGSLVASILNLLYACMALAPGIHIQILTFILYAVGRTFTFSFIFAFINIEFGLKYFGLLCGIIMMFAGLVNLLLNVIGALIVSGDLTVQNVQYMQLGVYVVLFYFPIYLFAKKGCHCRMRQKVKKAEPSEKHRSNRTSSHNAVTSAKTIVDQPDWKDTSQQIVSL